MCQVSSKDLGEGRNGMSKNVLLSLVVLVFLRDFFTTVDIASLTHRPSHLDLICFFRSLAVGDRLGVAEPVGISTLASGRFTFVIHVLLASQNELCQSPNLLALHPAIWLGLLFP